MTEEGSPFGKNGGPRHGKAASGPGQGVRQTLRAAGAQGWTTRLAPSPFPKTGEIRGQEGAFGIQCSKEQQELLQTAKPEGYWGPDRLPGLRRPGYRPTRAHAATHARSRPGRWQPAIATSCPSPAMPRRSFPPRGPETRWWASPRASGPYYRGHGSPWARIAAAWLAFEAGRCGGAYPKRGGTSGARRRRRSCGGRKRRRKDRRRGKEGRGEGEEAEREGRSAETPVRPNP